MSQRWGCSLRNLTRVQVDRVVTVAELHKEVLAAGSIGFALAGYLKFSLNCSLEGRTFMKYFLINLNKKYLALVTQSLEAKRRGLV